MRGETYRQQENERLVTLFTVAFDTSDGQRCKTQANVMKALCNSYIRSVQERLGIKVRRDSSLMSG